MSGKLAIITGGSTGLGYALARYLANRQTDWTIVVASRNPPFPDEPLPSNIVHHPLDCSSLRAVRHFFEELTHTYPRARIHALVLNAGVQIVQGVQMSVDGMEMTFATNHVGTHDPAQKTNYPAPDYQSAENCATGDLEKTTMQDGQHRYSRSKMVNIMWAIELRKQIKQAGLHYTVAAFDPGLMPGTRLARGFPGPLKFAWLYVLPYILPILRVVMFQNIHTTSSSAATYANLILDANLNDADDLEDVYWDYSGALRANPVAYSDEKLADLWRWTLAKVSQDDDERTRFASLRA